jgi:alanine racemase
MTRDARAVIDLTALRHNLQVARDAAPAAKVLAVVKGNGYGHGLLPTAQALTAADGLAVSCLSEALPLREAGIAKPIVLLEGLFDARELELIEQHRLDLVVHSLWQVEALERAGLRRPPNIWLKVDSGMHRLGLPARALRDAYRRLRDLGAGNLRLMTHLACADDRSSDYTRHQLAEFSRACEGLVGERSIANSAGLLAWPDTRADWVRPGIMLYGASPFADDLPQRPSLRPVMTLSSRIIAIQTFRRGERIGYAGAYTCPEDMPIGVVAMGYADGYPRHAPTGTPALVNGQRTQLVGRVSMDMLCVDLRGVGSAQVHDSVTLWGEGLPVEEVAQASGTISYELLCKLTGRVRFDYLGAASA